MAVPIVAIVGRPNVGKSSLFNWLAGRRIAIVDPTAGVTRDRVKTLIKADERYFELTDTGGIGIEDVDDLTAEIEQQIQIAIDSADAQDGAPRRGQTRPRTAFAQIDGRGCRALPQGCRKDRQQD